MSFKDLSVSEKLVPKSYLKLAQDAQKCHETATKELLEKRKWPEKGWTDAHIENLLQQLAVLDSNNFANRVGLGEREARIACNLVARRHYNFGHGIGRSGDLLEAQPKAAGSTLLSNLANALLLDLIREMGVRSCRACFLVPMATGMTLTLCLLTLKKQRPTSKYVLWSRIDQKSCFKSMTTVGLQPVVIDTLLHEEHGLVTDVEAFERKVLELGASEILCIYSTTSCFAPRNCDDIVALAALAARADVPHLVNNAYGLQSTLLTHQLEQAQRNGRVDLFVQSTDKNLMVPVGGAVVAGFNDSLVGNVAKTYAGRASSSQTLDVFMTLLSLGKSDYKALTQNRKTNFEYLRNLLLKFAKTKNEIVFDTNQNPISLAITLSSLSDKVTRGNLTEFGSMLYTRGVSGVRVVTIGEEKDIDGHRFQNWGSHHTNSRVPYLTVAAALGITKMEIDKFFIKLKQCWELFASKGPPNTKEKTS